MTRSDDLPSIDPALSRWIDGRCDDAEARQITERLASEPGLKAEVESLRAAMDAFREDVPTTVPHGLAERVLASAARGDDESERFRALARRYAAAAAVLLAVGVGGSVWVAGAEGFDGARDPSGSPSQPTLSDLVDGHMKSEQYVALDALSVRGR